MFFLRNKFCNGTEIGYVSGLEGERKEKRGLNYNVSE
jgi:hypothetical protein